MPCVHQIGSLNLFLAYLELSYTVCQHYMLAVARNFVFSYNYILHQQIIIFFQYVFRQMWFHSCD
jgi:hypothetical protein